MTGPGAPESSPAERATPKAATDRATPDEAAIKVVFGYSAGANASYADTERLALDYLEMLQQAGFSVVPFRLDVAHGVLRFAELDRRWRWGDRELLALHERLERACDGATAFINGPGVNLHPRFVEKLPVVTVFQCFDDPESSEHLSRPVAPSYDVSLVGNIAEVETYAGWGAQRPEWIPMGILPGFYDPHLTAADIMEKPRPLDLLMLSDRLSRWRRARSDELANAFPDADFYGPGWPKGSLFGAQRQQAMLQAKIGPNLHNSTGPVNFRTFTVPANGMLQICDNRTHFGRIYELGIEAVGFDTIKECVELCRYYLAHDEERRRIAVAGWRRVRADYSEVAVHRRRIAAIRRVLAAPARRQALTGIARVHRDATRWRHHAWPLVDLGARAAGRARRMLRSPHP
jgi:hypothetical protein